MRIELEDYSPFTSTPQVGGTQSQSRSDVSDEQKEPRSSQETGENIEKRTFEYLQQEGKAVPGTVVEVNGCDGRWRDANFTEDPVLASIIASIQEYGDELFKDPALLDAPSQEIHDSKPDEASWGDAALAAVLQASGKGV